MKLCQNPDCFEDDAKTKRTPLPDGATDCDMCGMAQSVVTQQTATGTTTTTVVTSQPQPATTPAPATTTVVTQQVQPTTAPAVDPLTMLAGQTVAPSAAAAPTTTVAVMQPQATAQPPSVTTTVVQPAGPAPATTTSQGGGRDRNRDRGDGTTRRERPRLDVRDLQDMITRGRFTPAAQSVIETGVMVVSPQPAPPAAVNVPDTRVQATPQPTQVNQQGGGTVIPAAHAPYAPPGSNVAGQQPAANPPQQPQAPQPGQPGATFNPFVPPPAAGNNPAPSPLDSFCNGCGKKFDNDVDSFCNGCGKKRA